MRYIPHTEADVRTMLDRIGADSVEDLFQSIPEKLQLRRPLDITAAATEQEVLAELRALAEENASSHTHGWFLGGGAYAHFAPSAVDAIVSRSEFYTSYTPYQPEISQGTLQTIFEWQTMISSLTGLDVSNASLYDGASAAAEAVLMALRVTRRKRVVVAETLHPHYREVVRTYLDGLDTEIATLPRSASGQTEVLAEAVDDTTACVVVQQPNFFGCIEDLESAAAAAHARGALLIVVVTEALSLALLRSPGEAGADIVCGEAQSFGVPLGFGGPHLGFLAARDKHVRQIPGRIAGQTVDSAGRRGFVLTLSTREQHIRRERATSNICTNQGLCLLMATVYLSLLGRVGLRRLAELNLARAETLKSALRAQGLALPFSAPTFNEFTVRVPDSGEAALERALGAGMVGGLDLRPFDAELGPAVLVCATEQSPTDRFETLATCLAGGAA